MPLARALLRFAYAPLLLLGMNGIVVARIDRVGIDGGLLLLLLAAIAISFAAERILPYERQWNASQGDLGRDVLHAAVNETLAILSVGTVPLLASLLPARDLWPEAWPFAVQVLLAVLAADLGITLCHWASHRVAWLWEFHAVHHSPQRLYGLNGLMKHPLHQGFETIAGTLPLLAFGLPVNVAAALAFCVAVQLLLQHSNVDYTAGPLRRWLATNEAHRFHHVVGAAGDVNFGLFTSLGDRLLGTLRFEAARRFEAGDLGIAGEPPYPTAWLAQLAEPIRRLAR